MKAHIRKWIVPGMFLLAVLSMALLFMRPAMTRVDPAPAAVQGIAGYGNIPLFFIPNQGQMDAAVHYAIQGKDKTLYFTSNGLTLVLTERPGTPPAHGKGLLQEIDPGKADPKAERKRWAVKLDFVGARKGVRPESLEQAGTVVSYFKGKPREWKAGLQTSSKIVYRDLWPGIDLVYYGTVNCLKYDFVVHPGADPSRIRLSYRGAESVEMTQEGRLEVSTPLGVFQDEIPVAWQEAGGRREAVSVAYAPEANRGLKAGLSLTAIDVADQPATLPRSGRHVYGFTVGEYDRSRTLVIDPAILVYCGYIGGSGYDEGTGIAVDGAGNAYVTGSALSAEATFPDMAGPDLTHNGSFDVFVAKLNAAGTALVYCGYIGGSNADYGRGIAVDGSGNAYVAGDTYSTEENGFPVTTGPDLTHNGGLDAFVAKVNAAGTALVYCGYLGGSGYDYGNGIAVDGSGSAYVTGRTESTETSFPVTVGPDLTHNGGFSLNYWDAFVAKVNAAGTALVYCGYLGGSGYDVGNGIAVDSEGSAYVTGETESTEADGFPVAVGPDLTYNGSRDAFVAKVNAAGTALVYCGYLGGSQSDYGKGIAVDGANNAYVTGETDSGEADGFPVVVGPDLTYNGEGWEWDAFVAKVNAPGTALVYCGYIGGSYVDSGNGIAVDRAGNAYVTGHTESTESSFPVTVGPDLTYNDNAGGFDVFVAKVNAAGTALVYCGYIGGLENDLGNGIAVDASGNAYVTGRTESTETSFPVMVGPDLKHNGNADVFVLKIRHDQNIPPVPSDEERAVFYFIPTERGAGAVIYLQ